MKVIRISAKHAHNKAKDSHRAVLHGHSRHVSSVKETNREITDHYKQQVEAHKERLAFYADQCEAIDAKHEEMMERHRDYEEARIDRDKKIADVKSKLPRPIPFPPPEWVCELLNWPRFPLPEKAAPEHPGYPPEPPAPEEPVLVEEHPEPELHFPEPVVYEAKQISSDDYEEIPTEWGTALAAPGSWVLQDEDNNIHIVPDEEFSRGYAKA